MAKKSKGASEAVIALSKKVKAKEAEHRKVNQMSFRLNAEIGILKAELNILRLREQITDLDKEIGDKGV